MKWRPKNKLAFVCGVEFLIFFILAIAIQSFNPIQMTDIWAAILGDFTGAATVFFVGWLMAHNEVIGFNIKKR